MISIILFILRQNNRRPQNRGKDNERPLNQGMDNRGSTDGNLLYSVLYY